MLEDVLKKNRQTITMAQVLQHLVHITKLMIRPYQTTPNAFTHITGLSFTTVHYVKI